MKTLTRISALMMMAFFISIGCEKRGVIPENPDSDRPTDVGPDNGKKGNSGSTDLGQLYGDLVYVLRNQDGLPIYNKDGFVQPLAFLNGLPFTNGDESNLVQFICALNDEGDVIPDMYYTSSDDGLVDPEQYNHPVVGEAYVFGPLEVEFGRTSLFRSPQRVLDQAIVEAMKGLAEVDVSTIQLDFCGRLFGIRPDLTEKTIDSPRENLAVYQNIMDNKGFGGLSNICTANNLPVLAEFFYNWDFDWLRVAAGCICAANDKTGTISVDKVEYVNSFKSIGDELIDLKEKKFFNFQDFSYSREIWKDVKIGFLAWDGSISDTPLAVFTVYELFGSMLENEILYGPKPQFTYQSNHSWYKETNVGGFAQYADDCNQVLEYVHGNSNLMWVR